ncbi:hypothetical protein [Aliarcobacter butzleri]|uniref:hypothetical protein n=1 Tax=Aliarcobacter butzleri TaxID=28197 RepID=UPI0021B26261|nr:hypothetical protein [Aliarcobacter butzleri]MCT7536990.1 hypothetical protein [Aliarcobacter butzleri]MCT7623470.1 hypothetical protein [Aliarcobacter butzleri]
MTNKKLIVIYLSRLFLAFSILFLFFCTYWIPYKVITTTSFNLIFLFSIFSVGYFSFIENKEDRTLLVDMWKIYFPSIFLLFSLVFSIDNYITTTKLDFYKTNLNYYLKQENKQNMEIAFKEYTEAITKHLSTFNKEEIKDVIQKNLINKQEDAKDKKYIFWYANFLVNVINILTLFMFLRCFVELSKFKIDKKSSIIYKKGKFIQR